MRNKATPSPKKRNVTRNRNARRNVGAWEIWPDPGNLRPAGYFRDKVLKLFREEDARGDRP
jgi:hypothetical protein